MQQFVIDNCIRLISTRQCNCRQKVTVVVITKLLFYSTKQWHFVDLRQM